MKENNKISLERWRLLLGSYAEENLPLEGGSAQEIDEVLSFLYQREYSSERGVRRDGEADLSPSALKVPLWINKIKKLFPKEARAILEKDALEKYNLTEILTNKELLEKMEPSFFLLKGILSMKSMLKGEVLETARSIVKKVVAQLQEKIESDVKQSLLGKINRTDFGGRVSLKTINFKRTIEKNLKNYDREKKRLVVERIYCHPYEKRTNNWDVIIVVDQSGSMINSVIYSAVMASIFWKLPMIRSKLIVFDTSVVDLSDQLDDPVETLMRVQLGGGTNISQALNYAQQQIENSKRTIVVLISDLFEGNRYSRLYQAAQSIVESEAKLIALTALDFNSHPEYDERAAQTLANLGAHVASLTPNELADWIGDIIK